CYNCRSHQIQPVDERCHDTYACAADGSDADI
uniref:5'-nucleotidase n=1 Tax=Parascaris univalens TaxID=6257 RepID=A0A915CA34_PARUN